MLKDYLCRAFKCRDMGDLASFIRERRNAQKVEKEIKRLTMVTIHLPKNRMFVCDGLDDKPAGDRTFLFGDKDPDGNVVKKRDISVVGYFKMKYRFYIEKPNIPCVFQNVRDPDGNRGRNYYPIDVLKIVGGQRVPVQKMRRDFVSSFFLQSPVCLTTLLLIALFQQDAMIKETRMDPEMMQRATQDVMRAASLNAQNPYTQSFGVPINSTPIVVSADILPSPAIQFAGNVREEPEQDGRLAWRPPNNRKYLVPGRINK